MFGNIIKLVFKSFAENSGISKWNDSVKASIGNMGQMSRAAQMLGSMMGTAGGAIGRLVGALAQGSVWGIATQSIAMLVERFDLFGKKAEEARKKTEELAEAARGRFDAVNTAAEKTLSSITREIEARQAMADIINRQTKAELELRRAEALRSGDTAKATGLEMEIAAADRQNAVDKAEAKEAEAAKRVAAAKRALDAAQKQSRDANRREAAAQAALAEKSKPVTMTMQSSAGAFSYTTKRDTSAEKSALDVARKDAEAADEAVDRAKAAYDIEVEKWKIAKESAKTVAAEQKAAEEKADAERVAAERKAEADRKTREKKAKEEWLRQSKIAERKAAEESWILHQKAHQKQLALMRELMAERLKNDQDANTRRADDLREKLKKAQADAAAAAELFRDPSQIDQAGERRAKRQEDIDRAKLAENAIKLQERKDWRTARLSNRDEATRRWLLAKENEGKQKNELKEVTGKLDAIKSLLEAATQL